MNKCHSNTHTKSEISMSYYDEDLAYVHHTGFGGFARGIAPAIIECLNKSAPKNKLVVDLGCGSGILARALLKANYSVLGIDISPAMLDIARKQAPAASFVCESVFKIDIPNCYAVLAVGECLNYLFDEDNNADALVRLFQKIYESLEEGGWFIFDVIEPGQVKSGAAERTFMEGEDWLVLAEKSEDPETAILTRRIITLRQIGESYRRSEETHVVQLYNGQQLRSMLQEAGFEVELTRQYGSYRLRDNQAVIVARK